jgi:hypothetical protein
VLDFSGTGEFGSGVKAPLGYALQACELQVGAEMLRWPAIPVEVSSGEGRRGQMRVGDVTRRNKLGGGDENRGDVVRSCRVGLVQPWLVPWLVPWYSGGRVWG